MPLIRIRVSASTSSLAFRLLARIDPRLVLHLMHALPMPGRVSLRVSHGRRRAVSLLGHHVCHIVRDRDTSCSFSVRAPRGIARFGVADGCGAGVERARANAMRDRDDGCRCCSASNRGLVD